MATLLLTAVGTLIGGPIGGALGALAGQQLDLAVIGGNTRRGPRLEDLSVQSSSYGAAIPRLFGRMRVAGSVIWATELVEHRDRQGGGKGRPKTVTYSYSSSFAVALASRPILGVGRIWADGNLLRGAAGDLKAAGALRIHTGHGDQAPDPLIAAAEGEAACPAFRNVAYAVFEDLELADFGNRIPSLTFEVFADDGAVSFASLVVDASPGASVEGLDQLVEGYAIEGGTPGDLLEALAAAAPLSCTVSGGDLAVRTAEAAGQTASLLPEPVAASSEDEPGAAFSRQRDRLPASRETALRYYDIARDYQPGIQRGRGRSFAGEAAVLDFPAALDASAALRLADRMARRSASPRETASYRVAQLDPLLSPGRLARLPGEPGHWLIEGWEWSSAGVELSLRALPHPAPASVIDAIADPGRANLPPDLVAAPTELAALELPWDGTGSADTPSVFAAASSTGAGWSGAALFAEQPDLSLVPLGTSGRARATIGIALTELGEASPHALDRASALTLELVAEDLSLSDASIAQLAIGANRALVGNELIQFARATPLSGRRWVLSDLLRGRGGTEGAIAGHVAGERFVLVDEDLTPLDPALLGNVAQNRVAALGLGDAAAVLAPIALAGVTQRPLCPVHGRAEVSPDGTVTLAWTRRARGAWLWRDGVEVSLAEQAEAYVVTLGDAAAPVSVWETGEPRLAIGSALAAQLREAAPGALLSVRQRGDRGLSEPYPLGPLP